MATSPQFLPDKEKSSLHSRLLMKNIKDYAILMTDPDGHITSWNTGAERIFGYAEAEIIGEPVSRIFMPEDRERGQPQQELRQAVAHGQAEDEGWLVRKDGTRFWASGVVTPLWDESGKLQGFAKVARDITERKQAEEALRRAHEDLEQRIVERTSQLTAVNEALRTEIAERKEAEQALRSSEERAQRELLELEQLYKTSPIGLCFVNTALCYLRVNQRLAAINGVAVAEHLRRPIRDVLPTLADQIEPHFRQVIGSGQPLVEQEVHGVTPAEPNLQRYFLASYYPVKGADGAVLGVSAAVQDITERKRFEAQLRHTQKLESLGVLAGGVAHDFNNLLTGILGNASLALNNLSTSNSGRARLEQVVLASQRAAELTNQLLAYSGRGHFLIQPVQLSELVSESSQLLRTAVGKTVQLRLELEEGLPPVEADRSQIQQLVMNLVLNAAEAVGEGSGTVRVRTGLQQLEESYLRETFAADGISPGPYVYLEVQDSGCGMTEEVRSKIFDPFFTTKLTGRGLGLAAVLGIVRGHRGAIQLDSAPGQGTTFKVLLPAAASRKAEPRAESPLSDLTGTGTLLVVDDEEFVRRFAQDVLEGCGYQVLEAGNGREAVELFRQRAGQIAGVLLDMTMPVMGGEEALRQLKSIRPEVRVVLSSGYNEVDAVRRFAGEGLADFIQKPYTPAALATKIKKALARGA
jgi:PAS domain S-box-containing protein